MSGRAIGAYAGALAGLLGFDPALARAVRDEVEDHLREAAAAERGCDEAEAERRAVARFGDARLLAAQFAAAALAREARRIGVALFLVLAAVLLSMASRTAWYDLTQWGLCENALELGATLGSIDRVAFLAAAAGGLAGWAWRGLRLGLWRLAALGLAASVACDAALTALRLAGWEFSADFLVPLASMAIELACAALLVYLVGRLSRRAFRTAPLLSG